MELSAVGTDCRAEIDLVMVVVAVGLLSDAEVATTSLEEDATRIDVVSVKVITELDKGSPKTVPVIAGAVKLIILAKLTESTATASSADMAVRFSFGICDEMLNHDELDVCSWSIVTMSSQALCNPAIDFVLQIDRDGD